MYDLQSFPWVSSLRCCKASDKSPSSPLIQLQLQHAVRAQSGRESGPAGPRFLDDRTRATRFLDITCDVYNCATGHHQHSSPFGLTLTLSLRVLRPEGIGRSPE